MKETASILEAVGVSKSYGRLVALDDVSLSFRDGALYGLYGRNGAGKTTLLNVLTSRIHADDGRVTRFGEDAAAHPGAGIGDCCYMPEKHYFPPRMRTGRILEMASRSFGAFDRTYADELTRAFDLNPARKYGQLSRGQQSALRVVIGLASRAPVTLFDEPVLGMDAVARDRFYGELIEDFAKHPRLMVVSTHLIEESADLFNEAVIIDKGRVIRSGAVEDLLSGAYCISGRTDRIEEFVRGKSILDRREFNGTDLVVLEGDANEADGIAGLAVSPLTIQTLFIHLTKDAGRGEEQS